MFGYTVVLKNGKQIEGTLVSETKDTIHFRTSSGEITFHKSALDLVAMEKLNKAQSSGKQQNKTYTNEDLKQRYGEKEPPAAEGPLSSAVDQLLDSVASAVPTPKVTRETIAFVVDSVIDGQTIQVRYNSGPMEVTETLHLLGVHSLLNECFGPEAQKYLAGLMPAGSKGSMETDRTKDPANHYLVYVYGADGQMVNLKMIRNGYARSEETSVHDRAAEFLAAQAKAMRDGAGLWRACLPIPKQQPQTAKPEESDVF